MNSLRERINSCITNLTHSVHLQNSSYLLKTYTEPISEVTEVVWADADSVSLFQYFYELVLMSETRVRKDSLFRKRCGSNSVNLLRMHLCLGMFRTRSLLSGSTAVSRNIERCLLRWPRWVSCLIWCVVLVLLINKTSAPDVCACFWPDWCYWCLLWDVKTALMNTWHEESWETCHTSLFHSQKKCSLLSFSVQTFQVFCFALH